MTQEMKKTSGLYTTLGEEPQLLCTCFPDVLNEANLRQLGGKLSASKRTRKKQNAGEKTSDKRNY